MDVEIIPVLPVQEACNYCEAQKCWTASLWWGEVLMNFYTLDKSRLEPERLNSEACRVLREVTKGLLPENDEMISPEALAKAMGNCLPILACIWADFRPAVCNPLIGFKNVVTIPIPATVD